MEANTIKNKKLRKKYFGIEKLKYIQKFIFINLLNSPKKTKKLVPVFSMFFKDLNKISKTEIKNKCVITGRNRSVDKKYSFSRIVMLDMLRFGIIPGYKKAVW